MNSTPGPRNKETFLAAFRLALKQVVGTYGLALFQADVPDVVLGARRGSPLILGIGKGGNFIVSDVSAIVAHTRDVVYLEDYDVIAYRARPLRRYLASRGQPLFSGP